MKNKHTIQEIIEELRAKQYYEDKDLIEELNLKIKRMLGDFRQLANSLDDHRIKNLPGAPITEYGAGLDTKAMEVANLIRNIIDFI